MQLELSIDLKVIGLHLVLLLGQESFYMKLNCPTVHSPILFFISMTVMRGRSRVRDYREE